MTGVIIEDEINSQEVLKLALEQFTEGIEIVGTAMDVHSGLSLISQVNPDLVFLDIELPDGTGFDILEKIKDKNVIVIFITAYDDFAIKAYKYSAIDYLLKPLNIDDLVNAVNRAKKRKENQSLQLEFLHQKLNHSENPSQEILVEGNQKYIKINMNDIIAFEVVENYVYIKLESGEKVLSSKTLKFYEDLLKENRFVRIHRSYIINTDKISSVDKGRAGNAFMIDGSHYEIATRRKIQLLNAIG